MRNSRIVFSFLLSVTTLLLLFTSCTTSTQFDESDTDCNTNILAEIVDPEENASSDIEETSGTPTSTSGNMPVMSGTSLDSVTKKAKEYGVTVLFDSDFGHGTKSASCANTSYGLMLSIVYSSSTNEILCAMITTGSNTTRSEQQNFIKEMAAVICPSADAEAVADWVNSNVGGEAQTEINGFTYEVSVGPSNNALYSAGEKNWEAWDRAQ